MKQILLIIALAAALVITRQGAAAGVEASGCGPEQCGDSLCLKERTLCLLKKDKADLALELLKAEQETFEGSDDPAEAEAFALLLAKAYYEQQNTFWALNTLDQYLESHAESCVAKSWMAWMHISEAHVAEARELLDDPKCLAGEGKTAARFYLLKTFIDIQKGEADKDTAKEFDKKKFKKLLDEDVELYRFNRRALFPHTTQPILLKLELKGGYTTNALFGSPIDPLNAGVDTKSALLAHDVRLTWAPPLTSRLSGLVELTSRSNVFFTDDTEDFTYVDIGWKLGPTFLMAPHDYPRLTAVYRGDVLFLNMPDRYDEDPPNVFYEGHRAELELALMPSFMVFAGGGRRFFREDVRTRWELDGGAALQKTLLGRLTLAAAVALRKYWALKDGYNLFGVSGLAQGILSLPKTLQLRAILSLHLDNYRDSFDYFYPGKRRRDTTVKIAAELSGMVWKGIRIAGVYEFSDKLSTIPQYAFIDHRVTVKITFTYGFDFLGLKKAGGAGHVPLDYGLGSTGESSAERIQDLLKKDEFIGGGAACGCRE